MTYPPNEVSSGCPEVREPALFADLAVRGRTVSRRGFSLVELLGVMVIAIILLAVVAPAVGTIIRGSNLTRAGQTVTGLLSLGRQVALSRNRLVEVRFFRYASPGIPGETPGVPSTGRFRAVQLLEIQDSGTAVALSRIEVLPDSVAIDPGSALSSLIGMAVDASSVPTLQNGAALGMQMPQAALDYDAVSFRFRPDGSTNLSRSARWFLTLRSSREATALSSPPEDYLTVQVDPANGHIKTFRP